MRARLLSHLAFLISLPMAASITGVVINTDGQPIAGARVSIYAPETVAAHRIRLFAKTAERTALATKQTDSKGTFSFDSPKDQNLVDLQVEANGFAPEAVRLLADDEVGAIALTAAPMQRGTITANGKPVAGANVVWLGNASDYVATTDADGHYSVPDPAKWANRDLIIHPDYAVVDEITGVFRAAPKLDHTLTAGLTIKGRVVGENGQTPVAKAPLLVDDLPLATTADDGTFTIEHAPKNWQEVEARSGALAGVRARSNDSAVTIRVARLGKITGTVRDGKTQLPLVNAEVRLGPATPLGRLRGFGAAGTTPAQDSVLTDAKGNFTISAAPGHYNLSAVYPGSAISNVTISVTAGQSVNKALYGNARGRVTGTVVDEDKRGIAAARVSSRNANRDAGPMMIGPGARFQQDTPAFSGPDGRFVLRMVPTEVDQQIDAAKKGLPAGHSANLRVNAGEKKSGVVITLPRGVALTGKVTDNNGKPVSGVGVEPVESTGGRGAFMNVRRAVVSMLRGREDEVVRTGSDGTFNLKVKEGTYDVVFKRDGFATKTLRAQTVNTSTKPVEVKLDPGVEISGRVVRNGVGVEGVNVNAMSEDGPAGAVTGSDGSFTITDLTPGQMMLSATKMDSFIQQVRPITAPSRDVVIQLPTGGRITGRVVDKSNHGPVTSFQAGISMSRGGGGMVIALPPMLKSFTTDDGTFTLENVPPGPTQLVVSAPGYTTAHIPGLNVEDGKTVSEIEVGLDTGVRLTGRVTGPDGAPVSGVSVREAGSNMGPMRMMTGTETSGSTDPNGEYAIEAIDPGQKTFTFQRQGYLAEDRTITLSGREARLDVQLSSGVSLNGIVVTEAGAPVADASVNAMSASDAAFGRQGRTDVSGNFQIAGLAPGHYTLVASKQGLSQGTVRDFDLSAGAPARIVMQAGGTIVGHVTGLSASDLENTTVSANGPNGNAQGEVDSSGSFRIDGAPTGSVRVSARTGRGIGAGGKTSPVQSVQVDPGASVTVDIQFKTSTVIRGRVTRNGQPMPNVMVMFNPRVAQSQTQASGTADSNGTYEISGLDDGTYNVGVVDIDRSNAFSSTYEVRGSGTFDIDIKTASLRGRVIDSSTGEPLASAQVQIQPKQGGFFSARAALTDPAGSFFVDNIARGSYQATAQKDGYGHDIRDITIGDSAPDDLEFKLSPSGGVTLHVVDARDNRALSANVLRVIDAQGRTIEGSGGFRFNSSPEPVTLTLAPGAYTVTLTAMGYAPKTVSVTSPADITVQMSPGGSLVLRSKSSAQQRVRLIDPKGAFYPRGPNGIFILDPSPLSTTLNNVSGGTWTLQVLNSSDQVINTIPITVVDGQQAVVDV